ncbi:uncharacterized protein [Bactrocera oleae]|uniref:uncharacterized protein n=1 Tax=Bactrocera oleae TaxID=104688 RepID=UPI00387E2EC5
MQDPSKAKYAQRRRASYLLRLVELKPPTKEELTQGLQSSIDCTRAVIPNFKLEPPVKAAKQQRSAEEAKSNNDTAAVSWKTGSSSYRLVSCYMPYEQELVPPLLVKEVVRDSEASKDAPSRSQSLPQGSRASNPPLDSTNSSTSQTLNLNTNPQAYTTLLQSTENKTQDPHNSSRKQVLLGTAIVQVSYKGQLYTARALIDSGSEATFISEKLHRKLDIPTFKKNAQVTGLNNTVSATATKTCELTLRSPTKREFKITTHAFILKTLTDNLPTHSLDRIISNKEFGFSLADPHFYKPRPVDILIGSDLYPQIILSGVQRNVLGSLLAQETKFGWILSGPTPEKPISPSILSFFNKTTPDKLLTQFWEVEEVPKKPLPSTSDILCEQHYQKTTRRHSTGRYVVTLPFKTPEKIDLGNSRHIALAQYLRNEKSLSRKPEIKTDHDKAINEYLELGHMTKIEYDPAENTKTYYLPHHAVIKPDRLTTQLRVVFNASCPSSNRNSLNDVLHTGPILQADLVILVVKCRMFRIVFNADIQKMYRQILVESKHTPFQRILYRRSPNDPIEDFELQTVTFGINCAPYLAIRTLLKLADDVQETHPLAAEILRNGMYVDDVLAGAHDVANAKMARNELTSSLESAGFALRKWTSNDPKVLSGISQEHLLDTNLLSLPESNSTKSLGIRWNAKKDAFFFVINPIHDKTSFTKREVLSIIAKLFDPAGWLSPVVVTAKIIMQQIWLDKSDWDESLKPLTLHHWKTFIKDYETLNLIEIPQWTHFSTSAIINFHGFSDASVKAYAANLYISVSTNTNTWTTLLIFKTRVSPIKSISLPRLELCGAVLLANLVDATLPQLNITQYRTHLWTDSTIVLSWLSKPPCSWTTFVSHRVATIAEKVGTENWRHIESQDNPADLGSRGCTPLEMVNNDLWWHGPQWLKLNPKHWPITQKSIDTTLELRPIKTFVNTTQEDILDRFSSLPKAIRVIAYLFRFCSNASPNRSQQPYTTLEITPDEFKTTRTK